MSHLAILNNVLTDKKGQEELAMWEIIEKIIEGSEYPIANQKFEEIFSLVSPFLINYINKCFYEAKRSNLPIPKSDFESKMYEILWKSVLDCQRDSSLNFKRVLLHRCKQGKNRIFLQYKKTSIRDDLKYPSLKWEELNTVTDYKLEDKNSDIESLQLLETVEKYIKKYPKKGLVIYKLLLGMKPEEIVKFDHNGDAYKPKYRKKVQRIRNHFCEFLKRENRELY